MAAWRGVAFTGRPAPARVSAGPADGVRRLLRAPGGRLGRAAGVERGHADESARKRAVLTAARLVRNNAGIERWTPLQPGQQLAPGDIIRTGDGSAILKMAESGSLIRVHGKTTVRFSPLQQGWETGALTGAP